MTIGIMQPYFFPYIGYFQLMNAVDEFVVYDNIQFTKKGWINRNRILVNGRDSYITLPLKKDSDYLDVRDRCLAEVWSVENKKMMNRIIQSYRKAPQFESAYPVIEESLTCDDSNLFRFILKSLNLVKTYLEIQTRFVISSTIPIDHTLKAEKKVKEICKARNANVYVNPIGGMQLYVKDDFKEEGVELRFLRSTDVQYKQFNNDFVPWLSIIDVMMFNAREEIRRYLDSSYTLI